MPQHLDSKDCWCRPKLMRPCPVCGGTRIHPADNDIEHPPPCPQCNGAGMITATHPDETTILRHQGD